MVKIRGIYCSTCKQEKGPGCENDNRCKSCKSEYERIRRINKRLAAGKPETRPERDAHCEECKTKKAAGISIGGRCNPCVTIANKIRLHAKRALEGKDPVSIRDATFCHVCNIPKVDGRCPPCRQRMAKELKAKRRAEKGKRPWGSGRQPTCYKCGVVKENPKSSHCNACTSEYNKKRWAEVIAPSLITREKSDKCKCGNERAIYSQSYCVECISAFGKARRELLHKSGLLLKRAPAMTPEARKQKASIRAITSTAIRKGYLMRQPCEVCGTEINVEAHHDDYDKPLDVRWLCKTHHAEHHLNERLEKQNAYT